MAVYSDPATFPPGDAGGGDVLLVQRGQRAVCPFPVPVEGDDISDIIVKYR